MRTRLYTIHAKGGRVQAVADRFSWWALLFGPLWLIWHGLWLTLFVMAVLVAAAALLLSAVAAAILFVGFSLLLAFEGAVFRRLELRFRGWREVGLVEAGTTAGAEETWLEAGGSAAPAGGRP